MALHQLRLDRGSTDRAEPADASRRAIVVGTGRSGALRLRPQGESAVQRDPAAEIRSDGEVGPEDGVIGRVGRSTRIEIDVGFAALLS